MHRLLNTLNFIAAIFHNLSAGMPLKDAVSEGYDRTLAQLHAWVVRAGIKTGMLALPTRETFLASIGETGGWIVGVGGWVSNGGGGGRLRVKMRVQEVGGVEQEGCQACWWWVAACVCSAPCACALFPCPFPHTNPPCPRPPPPGTACCRGERAAPRRRVCGGGAQAGGAD